MPKSRARPAPSWGSIVAAFAFAGVLLEMSAGTQGSFWYVNYGHPTKRHALQVTFDANTGAFNKAIK